MLRTIENLRKRYRYACDEDLQRYIDLRNEGYPVHQAELMAGLVDPPDEEDE